MVNQRTELVEWIVAFLTSGHHGIISVQVEERQNASETIPLHQCGGEGGVCCGDRGPIVRQLRFLHDPHVDQDGDKSPDLIFRYRFPCPVP